MKTVIFTDKKGDLTLSVKKSFLKVCPHPEKYTGHELAVKFNLPFYLHREDGPAVIDHRDDNGQSYWLNGQIVRGNVYGKPVTIRGATESFKKIKKEQNKRKVRK